MSRRSALVAVGLAALITIGAADAASTISPYSVEQARYLTQQIRPAGPPNLPTGPIAIALNYGLQTLEYWPIDPKGGRHPHRLAEPEGLSGAGPMAANGSRVVIANQNATNLVVYDLAKHRGKILADPDGYPIDVAIDTAGGIYASSVSGFGMYSVLWYPRNSLFPQSLNCRFLNGGPVYIAVDNEGDVFLNDNGTNSRAVVEIPRGPRGPDPAHCGVLNLKPETRAGGIAVDPKTDDLVMLDAGDCAGSGGTMTIYPKPYKPTTGISHAIGGACPMLPRLDAASTIMLFVDQFEGFSPYVGQRSYPDGKKLGSYFGGNPAGITTIPNTLPN